LAEGVSAELASSVNQPRPTKPLLSWTYPHHFIQPHLVKSGEIPHKLWG
jgi:hypothetical protein